MIAILRHGKPEFEFTGKIRSCDLQGIIDAYDASGVREKPPPQTLEMAARVKTVVCSNLLRSLQSATALGFSDIHLSDPLFREAGLPYADWRAPKMPLAFWLVLFRIFWAFGYSHNCEPISLLKKRARSAAQRLDQLAEEKGSVLFVGHGFFNRFLAQELIRKGWKGPANPGQRFWQFAVYRKEQ